jgi:hypothetical protein
LLVLPGIVLAQRARQKGVATPTTCQDNELCNPLAGVANTPQELIGRVINQLMGVVGSIALLMFVYGGLIWMTSSGNPEKVKEGRGILIWSAIGLAVIFFSYGLVRLVLAALGK